MFGRFSKHVGLCLWMWHNQPDLIVPNILDLPVSFAEPWNPKLSFTHLLTIWTKKKYRPENSVQN